MTAVAGLEAFDGRILDGLNFCHKAYRLLHRIRGESGGIEELRLRTTLRAKRLVEEILPIAAYLQSRYSGGRVLRVRWMGGSQSYDARVYWAGPAVRALGLPRVQHVEVTTAVHANAYLVRELVQAEGGAFGSKGTWRDAQTRKVLSKPVVEDSADRVRELAQLVQARIDEKSGTRYPQHTTLVVACEFDFALDTGEWRELVGQLHPVAGAFREIILVDEPMCRVETL